MLPRPDLKTINTIKDAARKLKGAIRRAFQAQVVRDHCNGNTSHAKTLFGWDQPTAQKALHEREKGEIIPDKPRKERTKLLQNIVLH